MIKEAILKLAKSENIPYDMAEESMNEIMRGEATDVQMSAYLTALSMKGETIDEITASSSSLRNHCVKLLHDMDVLEIVGTGGDGSNSFNISTISSLVISAGGVPVAKHGNRASSSKCGSADVLEELGVNIDLPPEKSSKLLKKIGMCFLFAQNYHISMKYIAPVRKELGIPTIFNILGPLTNPAGANMELMGVYDEKLVVPLAKVLNNLGVKNVLVVYGHDKLDEISISSPTTIYEIKEGVPSKYIIKPEDFGFKRAPKDAIQGGSPSLNSKIAIDILNGAKGYKRDAILLNAGAGLYIGGKSSSLDKGVAMAENILDSGKAKKQLNKFIQLSNTI